jgi:hypothetical protein
MEQKNIIKEVIEFMVKKEINFFWKNILWHIVRVMEEEFNLSTVDYDVIVEETSYGTKTISINKWEFAAHGVTSKTAYKGTNGFTMDWFSLDESLEDILSDDEFEAAIQKKEDERILSYSKVDKDDDGSDLYDYEDDPLADEEFELSHDEINRLMGVNKK